MAKSKKQIIEAAVKLVEELEVLEAATPEHVALLETMTEELKVVELEASLAVLKEDHEAATTSEDKKEAEYQPVWRCGQGVREIILAAPDKAAAMNELLEIEPVFKAIGAVAEPMKTHEGYPLFALIEK